MTLNLDQGAGRVAYCTLVTNDAYVTAALVLAKSLRNTGTTIPLAVMVTPKTVSPESRQRLSTLFDDIVPVSTLSSEGGAGAANLALIGRPDLAATLTKLQLWSLTQYSRLLYLDADTLVLQNVDRLLERLPSDVRFAASPEIGFPDCFNSGVMLLKPCEETHAALLHFATEHDSFDGGDQGLLNQFFGDGTRGHPIEATLAEPKRRSSTKSTDSGIGLDDGDDGKASSSEEEADADVDDDKIAPSTTENTWFRLSFTYNMEMHKVYRFYIPAALRYRDEHKILHFIGKEKPWHFPDGVVDTSEDPSPYFRFYAEMIGKWWQVRNSVAA